MVGSVTMPPPSLLSFCPGLSREGSLIGLVGGLFGLLGGRGGCGGLLGGCGLLVGGRVGYFFLEVVLLGVAAVTGAWLASGC